MAKVVAAHLGQAGTHGAELEGHRAKVIEISGDGAATPCHVEATPRRLLDEVTRTV